MSSECEIKHWPQTDMFWSHSTGLGLKYCPRQAKFTFKNFFMENVGGTPTIGEDAVLWHLKAALKLQM